MITSMVWSPTLGSEIADLLNTETSLSLSSTRAVMHENSLATLLPHGAHAPPYSLHDSVRRLLEIPVFGGQLPVSLLLLVMSMLFFFFETESMHLWSMRFFWS